MHVNSSLTFEGGEDASMDGVKRPDPAGGGCRLEAEGARTRMGAGCAMPPAEKAGMSPGGSQEPST